MGTIASRLALVGIAILACGQIASAAPLDIVNSWAYPAGSPYQIPSHNQSLDGYNEFIGNFLNESQSSGDNALNLIDYNTKSPTGVSVTWAGFRRTNANIPAAFSADTLWVLRDATGAQLSSNDSGSTTGTITFHDLPAAYYQVEVVMTGNSAGSLWDVDVKGNNADHTRLGGAQNAFVAAWDPKANGSNLNDWLIWDSVPIADGTLDISAYVASPAGTEGLAAVRISEVGQLPEPGTLSLLSGGALLLLARRRRNAAQV